MPSSYFFLQVDKNENNSSLIDRVEQYSIDEKKQVYVIDKPLGDNKYTYEYQGPIVLLIPNYKIIFVNFSDEDDDEFDDYVEDFIEDLGSISDKFRYKNYIGRPRNWRDDLITTIDSNTFLNDFNGFLDNTHLDNGINRKKGELLISLLTGSINDIEKVKGNVPDNFLDKIKQKIVLFDGDQTRFVYHELSQKRVDIQGLSGTGKTELLLHKLKELYVADSTSRIMFTCHNKILADNLKNRIPGFFNFMKVEEQIEWDKRLWCVNAWGSKYDKNTGAYRFICDFYNLQSYGWSRVNNFEVVCQRALESITDEHISSYGYAFDNMLIDESQDFPESFFSLCERVTATTVFIAGDIFQSIFSDTIVSEIQPDFLLSKCYRTDPRTLMFAHAIGMGLFENPKLRWLEDREWVACGYNFEVDNTTKKYTLTREPLRRFEDLVDEEFESVALVKTKNEDGHDVNAKIIEIIKEIREENPTVLADDIGVIFIENNKNTYTAADILEVTAPREFGWEVNKAYESKEKLTDTLFVSNRNNVKGLEFPFVICVTGKIQSSRSYRNALYMMLTRSFLKTYLLVSEERDLELAQKLGNGLHTINEHKHIKVIAPTEEEIARIKTTITHEDDNISYYDSVYKLFDELNIHTDLRKKLFGVVKQTIGDEFKYEEAKKVAIFNYNIMTK